MDLSLLTFVHAILRGCSSKSGGTFLPARGLRRGWTRYSFLSVKRGSEHRKNHESALVKLLAARVVMVE